MKERYQVLDGFWLKIIAFLTMTIDHIGLFMIDQFSTPDFTNSMYLTGYIFRLIGRIAFPIFILLLVEGLRHSHDVKKYLARLGIMAGVLLIIQIILFYNYSTAIGTNPFVDLFLSGLFIYGVTQKGYKRLLIIFPLLAYGLSFGVHLFEGFANGTVFWLPEYLRTSYSIYGFLMAIGFYFSYKIASLASKRTVEHMDLSMEEFEKGKTYRSLANTIICSFLLVLNLLFWGLSYLSKAFDFINMAQQSYSVLAVIVIAMYNGYRGYNKKWFEYGSYLYFPLHILIIFIIFGLTFGF